MKKQKNFLKSLNIHPESSKTITLCATILIILFIILNLGRLRPNIYDWIGFALAIATVLISIIGKRNRLIGGVTGIFYLLLGLYSFGKNIVFLIDYGLLTSLVWILLLAGSYIVLSIIISISAIKDIEFTDLKTTIQTSKTKINNETSTTENNLFNLFKIHPEASKPIILCALGLIVSFFLPWFSLLGITISGYNIGELGSYGNLTWIVLILAIATLIVSFAGRRNQIIGGLNGVIPLFIIFYIIFSPNSGPSGEVIVPPSATSSLSEEINRLLFHSISIGGYLTIILCVIIIVFAIKDY